MNKGDLVRRNSDFDLYMRQVRNIPPQSIKEFRIQNIHDGKVQLASEDQRWHGVVPMSVVGTMQKVGSE